MSNSTSAPQPAGLCLQCGGQLYIGLTHGCMTSLRWSVARIEKTALLSILRAPSTLVERV